MLLKINAKAFGILELEPVASTAGLENEDFMIHSNRPRQRVGDGRDEQTEWAFDFTVDPNWADFSFDQPLVSAMLTLTVSPKGVQHTNDKVGIKGMGQLLAVSAIQELPIGETHTLELDLLREGYTSRRILRKLREGRGRLEMAYKEDAIIPFAELQLAQEAVSSGRLHVMALSEDTIASPGDRDANYIVLSISDDKGQPVSGLGKANFEVDATIVGPGGSLVSVEKVIPSSRMEGIYILLVKPVNAYTWAAGTYIFSITVKNKNQCGQALASVLMD